VAQFLQTEATRQNREVSSARRAISIALFLLLGTALAGIGFFEIRAPASLERVRFSGLAEFNIHPLTAQAVHSTADHPRSATEP
jgi:hypothetical protein